MLKPPFDYTLIAAQLPSQSPSEIDAALKALSEYCVINGKQLPKGLEEQLLNIGNHSVLISLARYCGSAEIFNSLWDRATSTPISSDNDIFRQGLRKACVLNRLAPLNSCGSLSYPETVWNQEKLEWLTKNLFRSNFNTEKDHTRWWNCTELLQNESVPIRILADAISLTGAFSKLDQRAHEALLRHISSNPIISNGNVGRLEDIGCIKNAVRSLLDARTRRIDYRAAVFDFLLSLTQGYGGGFTVPPIVLKQWQFPNMPEILANGGKTSERVNNPVELMPLVAFATWPVNVKADGVPSFYHYAAEYVTKDMTLREMLNGSKRDGNLFCLLAIWNIGIMRSVTKRAMLQQMIAGHVKMASPIPEDKLREIYNKRTPTFEQNYESVRGTAWAFEAMPSISRLKWRVRLRRVYGLSKKKDDAMLDVARAINEFHSGGLLTVFLKCAEHILGVFALWFTVLLIFLTVVPKEELKALMVGLKSFFTSPP